MGTLSRNLLRGGVAALTSISLFSATTSTAATIAWPASIAAGDVAILLDAAIYNSSVPPKVIPTGFTEAKSTNFNGSLTDITVTASYKILTGSESGSITGQDGLTTDQKYLYIFRGNIAITVVTPSTWNGEGTVADPVSQSVAASGQPFPLVVLACAASGGVPSFTTASPAFDADTLIGNTRGAYKIYGSAPATHSIDMGDYGTANVLISGYLSFT